MTAVFLFGRLPLVIRLSGTDEIPHFLLLHIPACLAIPARMRRAEPGQVLFQLRSLSGKFNTAFIDDILFQLCQQRFIPCPIRLVIGAFACELLIDIISHITELSKQQSP